MRRALAERGVPSRNISTIHNWALREAAPARRHREGDGLERFVIVYAGNFGRAQGLATAIEAAEILARRRQDIEIRLIGDGLEFEALRQRAENVQGVSIEPRVSGAEIDAIIANADAVLLHLRDEALFRITVPSKTQAYLAYGRPVVAAVAGEAADLLGESGAAIVVPPSDAAALADAIAEMADLAPERRESMGAAGRRFYLAKLSFRSGMAATLSVIDAARAA
jgi:glycosyltransferase involved in cell wall biosynthesis